MHITYNQIFILGGYDIGCNAWGGGGTVTLCTGVGDYLIGKGSIEEAFMHEGAHVTMDREIYPQREWKCARDSDHAYISGYAKDHPTR